MANRPLSPAEAADLQAQGYTYVDVRSAPEFEAGRPASAVNIPVFHRNGMQMAPNAEFVGVLKAAFPPGAKFVIGCQSGSRTTRAAEILAAEGYPELLLQMGGFVGWANARLPVESGPAVGADWESMRKKVG